MGEVAASKTQDQKFDVQHSKSEFRKGKGRNHEANAKDEAKPLPVHDWPTLGAKPTTVAQVPGGAWGKTGGAVKQLKEAEEMKHVKKRQQKPEEERRRKMRKTTTLHKKGMSWRDGRHWRRKRRIMPHNSRNNKREINLSWRLQSSGKNRQRHASRKKRKRHKGRWLKSMQRRRGCSS